MYIDRFFKAEIRSSGEKILSKVSIPSASDTQIHAYIKSSPPVLVHLASDNITSNTFTAECSCPAARKRQFCKHVWAAIRAVEEKHPDFLNAKTNIEKEESPLKKTALSQVAAKARAAEMRKQQYEKQKARVKELKKQSRENEMTFDLSVLPETVQKAVEYFTQNGFPMPQGPSELIACDAKRKLSRVFHPDKGGANHEMHELNQNVELILKYLHHG